MKFTDHKISINNVDYNKGPVSFFVVYKINKWSELKSTFDNDIFGTCISKTVDNHGRGIMFAQTNRGAGLENNVVILGVKTANPNFNFAHVGYVNDIQYKEFVVSKLANYQSGAVAGKPDVINIVSVHYNGSDSYLSCNGIQLPKFEAETLNPAIEWNLGNRVSQGSTRSDFKGIVYDFIVQRGTMTDYRIDQIHDYLNYKWISNS